MSERSRCLHLYKTNSAAMKRLCCWGLSRQWNHRLGLDTRLICACAGAACSMEAILSFQDFLMLDASHSNAPAPAQRSEELRNVKLPPRFALGKVLGTPGVLHKMLESGTDAFGFFGASWSRRLGGYDPRGSRRQRYGSGRRWASVFRLRTA